MATIIIIKTGYTDRLIDGAATDDDTNDMAVIYTDKVWNKNLKPLINDQETFALSSSLRKEKLFAEQNIDSSGMVVFKDMDMIACIETLRDIQYCMFPAMEEIDSEEVFEVEGFGLPLAKAKVMIVTLDCESG